MEKQYAYAYITNGGEINTRCISSTIVGAQVNATVIESNRTIFPMADWDEGLIEEIFLRVVDGKGEIKRIRVVVDE